MAKSGKQIQAEGGPAFPNHDGSTDGSFGCPSGWEGMTLRDYFAGQALVGLAIAWAQTSPEDIAGDSSVTAAAAYMLADEMLKARK